MGRESPGANSPDTMRAPMMRVTCALIVLIELLRSNIPIPRRAFLPES